MRGSGSRCNGADRLQVAFVAYALASVRGGGVAEANKSDVGRLALCCAANPAVPEDCLFVATT